MAAECLSLELPENIINGRVNIPSITQDETDLAATRRSILDGITPPNKRVHWFWDIVALGSILTFIADIGSDLFVAGLYFSKGEYTWFGLTLGFVCFSSITLQIFSAKWFYEDEESENWLTYVLHFLHVGPVVRYWRAFRSGWRTRRKDASPNEYQYFLGEWRDIGMLRLFEAYLESAPQLILQLYILSYHRRFKTSSDLQTVITAACSLGSLAWSIVAYTSALREFMQNEISLIGFFFQILWRLFMLASRITALVIFASFFNVWLFVAVGIHWLLMFLFLVMQYSTFCTDIDGNVHPCREVCYNGIIAFVYNFSFFNITEGATRLRLVLYYTLTFIENTVFVVLWYPHRALFGDVSIAAMCLVFGGFVAGLFFMMIYYHFYHPNISQKGFCFKRGEQLRAEDDNFYMFTKFWCCCCEVQAIRNTEIWNGSQTGLPIGNGNATTGNTIHPIFIDLDIVPRHALLEHIPHLVSPSEALHLRNRGRVEMTLAPPNSPESTEPIASAEQTPPMWI